MTQVTPLMTQFGGTTDQFLGAMKAATRDEVRWGQSHKWMLQALSSTYDHELVHYGKPHLSDSPAITTQGCATLGLA